MRGSEQAIDELRERIESILNSDKDGAGWLAWVYDYDQMDDVDVRGMAEVILAEIRKTHDIVKREPVPDMSYAPLDSP